MKSGSIKRGTWVLVADGARARLFVSEGAGEEGGIAFRPALGKE
jgi:hypothetical protein